MLSTEPKKIEDRRLRIENRKAQLRDRNADEFLFVVVPNKQKGQFSASLRRNVRILICVKLRESAVKFLNS